jgi:protein-S-isoprenylcysteine O-methyltransferase Ste14
MSRRDIVIAVLVTLATVGQILLAFLLYNHDGNSAWRNAGWVVLWISAIFGWLPIYAFRTKGGVAKGQSYMQTTQLVDSGIYGIVRHPQYFAGVLISVALPMIAQRWVVAAPGVVATILYYLSAADEDESCIEKFGDAYRDYMRRVPKMNVLTGILRQIRRVGSRSDR